MVANISMIVAKSKNNAIGKDNELLWDIPEDLRFFKNKTNGKVVLMGRKTYESIGRPLPNRRNLVLTRNVDYNPDGAIEIANLNDAYNFVNSNHKGLYIIKDKNLLYAILLITTEEMFVIGGQSIYEEFIQYTTNLYVTEIDEEIKGDTFFPEINDEFKLKTSVVGKHSGDDYSYRFDRYVRSSDIV